MSAEIVPSTLTPCSTRLREWLRTEVPLNYRTILFCFFVGTLFSVPLGILVQAFFPHQTPEWTQVFYGCSAFGSFLILPFWTYLLRGWPVLYAIGKWVAIACFAIFILGSLLPSL